MRKEEIKRLERVESLRINAKMNVFVVTSEANEILLAQEEDAINIVIRVY